MSTHYDEAFREALDIIEGYFVEIELMVRGQKKNVKVGFHKIEENAKAEAKSLRKFYGKTIEVRVYRGAKPSWEVI